MIAGRVFAAVKDLGQSGFGLGGNEVASVWLLLIWGSTDRQYFFPY